MFGFVFSAPMPGVTMRRYCPAPVPLSTTAQPPAHPPALMSPALFVSLAVVMTAPSTRASGPK